MRGAMPNKESVLLLMGKTAMDKKSYLRQVPKIEYCFQTVFQMILIEFMILPQEMPSLRAE